MKETASHLQAFEQNGEIDTSSPSIIDIPIFLCQAMNFPKLLSPSVYILY